MIDEQKLERILDDARVPREVHIGTDSVEDRIIWLVRRSRANERTAEKRFEAFEVEFGVLAVLGANGGEWLTVGQVQEKLGYGEREEVSGALYYLANRKLIDLANNGFEGDLFTAKD